MQRLFLALIVACLSTFITFNAKALSPTSFTVNGFLQEDGAPVNAERLIKAQIINESSAVVAEISKTVPIESGKFTLIISDIEPQEIALAKELYLAISIDGELLEPVLKVIFIVPLDPAGTGIPISAESASAPIET